MDEIREQNSAEEMIDVYDPQHRRTGRSVRRGEPLEGGERLLVAHVCVFNGKNERSEQFRLCTEEIVGLGALKPRSSLRMSD